MVNKQKSYKEQLLELYGQGQQQTGGTQTGSTQGGTAGQGSNAMLELIMNRQPFSYDAKTDPAARAVRQETARNAKLATANTLGSYAGMTGGMPSTAAVSAAAQAGNTAMQTGADRITELKELAYRNYQNEGQDMQNIYAMMQQQEADAYSRGRDALADQRYAEEQAYAREQAQKQWDYGVAQDAYAREQAQKQWDYGVAQDAYAREQEQKQWDYGVAQDEYQKKLAIAELKAQYRDYSGLKELGVDVSKYLSGGSGGGYYSSGGGGGSGGSGGGGGSGGNGGNGNNSGGSTIPASVSDNWWLDYGGVLPVGVWASAAAQYGEQALIDAGFKKAAAQKPAPGQSEKPGGGNNRVNLEN